MPKTSVKSRPLGQVGQNFGKRDVERVGFFSECCWLHGVPYVSPHSHEFRAGAVQGRQLLGSGGKLKAGLQDCFFDKGPFKRIFEKEAYSSSVRENYLASMAASKRNVSSQAFYAGAPGKKHSTPGDFFGTFGGNIPAFSWLDRPRPPHAHEPPNVKTNPGKKGTYGFYDTTINKFPSYMPGGFHSRFEGKEMPILDGPIISTCYPKPCFDMNPWRVDVPASTYVLRGKPARGRVGPEWIPPHFPKKQGNNHDGCFSKFPPHMPEKYVEFYKVMRGPREAKIFIPPMHPRSKYTASVANRNVDFRVNSKNWRTVQPMTYKFDLLAGKSGGGGR